MRVKIHKTYKWKVGARVYHFQHETRIFWWLGKLEIQFTETKFNKLH